jgi:hypothetical protein
LESSAAWGYSGEIFLGPPLKRRRPAGMVRKALHLDIIEHHRIGRDRILQKSFPLFIISSLS